MKDIDFFVAISIKYTVFLAEIPIAFTRKACSISFKCRCAWPFLDDSTIDLIAEANLPLLRSAVVAATFVLHTALRDDALSGAYYEDRERVRLQPDLEQKVR